MQIFGLGHFTTFGTSGRSSCSWLPFRLAMKLVDRYLHTFPFSITTSSHRTDLANVDVTSQKPWARPLSRPCRPFLGPLAAILDFAGGAAL